MQTQTNQAELNFSPIELHSDEIYGQINSLVQEKKYLDAVAVIGKHESKQINNPAFLLLAAQTHRERKDFVKEYKYLEKLIVVSKKPRNLILFTECLIQLADFPRALKVLHEVLDICDDQQSILFEVYKNMGNIYLKCGDIEAAEDSYNKANRINSQDENLMVNYGVLAIQKGNYEAAKERFSAVVYMNSGSDLAWVGLALVHRAHGDLDLSRACLLRGMDENPYNKIAVSNYYMWSEQDSVDSNSIYIEKYLNEFPQDSEIENLYKKMSH